MHALTAKVVLGLANVHPVAGKNHLEDLALSSHVGEDFALDGGRSILNTVDDASVEEVQTSVDLVADENLGLLDELLDLGSFLVSNDNTILGGVLDGGDHDGTLTTVALVELDHLIKRIVANDVGVEHEEEARRVVSKDEVLGKADGTGGTKRLALERASNLDIVLLLEDFEFLHHDLRLVVDSKDNFSDTGASKSLNLMAKDG